MDTAMIIRQQKVVVELLKENKQTVTAAESLTAGAFQAALGDIAGVSEVFPGGFVTYSLQTKAGFLEIDPELLAIWNSQQRMCGADGHSST